MYLPAHLATGYVVGKGVGRWSGLPVAFFSHYVLDWCWNMLYHDDITVATGAVMGVASVLLIWFGRQQWPCMLAATITDWERVYGAIMGLDWAGPHYHRIVWDLAILKNAWFSVGIQAAFALLIVLAVLRERKASIMGPILRVWRAHLERRRVALDRVHLAGEGAPVHLALRGLVIEMWERLRAGRSTV